MGLLFISCGVIFANLLWIFGILLLGSAYFSFCPFYKLFKLKTNKNDKIDSNSCGCGSAVNKNIIIPLIFLSLISKSLG
ncbi:MAG: DUF2892 domain-containing protein [Helicobacteraceae bacterium]|nr:DUF2892 domain-containing protein [Helicobacteraceae bacterium]